MRIRNRRVNRRHIFGIFAFFVVVFVAAFTLIHTSSFADDSNTVLKLATLTPTFNADKVSINQATGDDDFDVTFYDNNEELTYAAVIKNNSNRPALINAINLMPSLNGIFEYEYSGIEIGDVLAANESRTVTIAIKTNDGDRHTITQDFNLSLDYILGNAPVDPDPDDPTPVDPDPDKPEPTPTPTPTPTPSDVPQTPNTFDDVKGALMIAGAATALLILGIILFFKGDKKDKDDKKLKMIIFALTLGSAAFAATQSVSAQTDPNTITYSEDEIYTLTISGKVRFSQTFTVTIDPNGGKYNNTTEPTVVYVKDGDTIDVANPQRDNYAFEHWNLDDDTRFDMTEPITKNTSIYAVWSPIVARIGETYYGSIMSAEEAAVDGDTIYLLVDTTEEVTNEKHVTLDLGNHKLTGSITNTEDGDLTLLNGTVENLDGAAVTNNGTLTMGVNDYKADGTSNVSKDSINLIGTTVGLKQSGIFNFYDGSIEGDIALDGGYDDSPHYRDTFDNTVVHFFPFVDHNYEKDCQHVALEASDRAVTKTTEHGDIYYYNVQDNINTSAVTGYTIYAVRRFDASYPLTIDEGTTITFDLNGFDILLADDLTNKGNLLITDGQYAENNNVAAVLNMNGTIYNNGKLVIRDAEIQEAFVRNLMENKRNLILQNATLSSTNGTVINSVYANAIMHMDETSVIKSSSTAHPAIYNTVELTIDGGTVESAYRGIYTEGTGALVTVDGGKVVINTTSSSSENAAVYVGASSKVILKSGEILVQHSGSGVYSVQSGAINMTGGKISSNSSSGTAYGVMCSSHYGCAGSYTGGEMDLKGSTVYGIGAGNNTLKNFKIKVAGGTACGIRRMGGYTQNVNITDSEITATGSSSYGICNGNSGSASINGNTTISGGTYGIYSSENITIGSNDGTIHADTPIIIGGLYGIYSSNVKFYDGVLKGVTAGYAPNTISAMATNSIPVRETEDIGGTTYQIDYLIEEIDYIDNNGIAYRKLQTAINEANNGDTLRLTASSANVDAITIPEGKEITIDFAGQHLDTQRQITNRGKVTIKSSVNNNNSYIRYPNSGYLITNYGELTIDNVDLKATNIVENMAGGVLNLKDIDLATSGVILTNNGQVAFERDSINGSVTMNSNVESTCINSAFIGYLDNQAGTFSTNNCSFVRPMDHTGQSGTVSLSVMRNAGTLNMSNSSIEAQIASGSNRVSSAYGITNSGTLTMDSNSTITINDPGTYYSNGRFGIHNSGTTTVADTNITISSKDKTYGLYNASGTSVFGSGVIDSRSTNYPAYGIYVQSGEVSLGIPEDPSSPNYGRDTANVSTTNPDVFAKGTTGIGVKNAGGKFNFYDGKIMGNTGHMPETPTKVEYLYEPVEHIDDATDYKYVQLEWMREQP